MSSFCWSFLPAVSRSQARVKYKTRRARWRCTWCVFLFLYFRTRRLPSCTPHRDCGACHVYVKPKFAEEGSSLKIHTPLKRLGKTFNDGPIQQNRPCSELGRRTFVPRDIDGAWREHSFPATCLRLEELTINSAIFLSVHVDFNKIAKRKTRKREWTVLVLWRRRACAFSRDRRLALHVWVTDRFSGVKKKCASMPCQLFWILVSFGRWKIL